MAHFCFRRNALIYSIIFILLVVIFINSYPHVSAGGSVKQSNANSGSNTAAAEVVTFSGGTTVGNVIVLMLEWLTGGYATVSSLSDSQHNTWINATAQKATLTCSGTGTDAVQSQIYLTVASTTSADSVSVTPSKAVYFYVAIFELIGGSTSYHTSSGTACYATAQAASLSVSSFSVGNSGIVLAGASNDNGNPSGWAAGTSYTLLSGSPTYGASEYATNLSGSTTAPMTQSRSAGWVETAITFIIGVLVTVNFLLSVLGTYTKTREIDLQNYYVVFCNLNSVNTTYSLYGSGQTVSCDSGSVLHFAKMSFLSNGTERWAINGRFQLYNVSITAANGGTQTVTAYYYNVINDTQKVDTGSLQMQYSTLPSTGGSTDNPNSTTFSSIGSSYVSLWLRLGTLINYTNSQVTVTSTSTITITSTSTITSTTTHTIMSNTTITSTITETSTTTNTITSDTTFTSTSSISVTDSGSLFFYALMVMVFLLAAIPAMIGLRRKSG